MSALYIQKKGIKQHTGSTTFVLDGGSNDFKLASYKRVCEDHFEVSCFLYDIQARLMGYQEKKVEKRCSANHFCIQAGCSG